MNIITDIQTRVDIHRETVRSLIIEKKYYLRLRYKIPTMYGHGTSYQLHDNIKGSRNDMTLDEVLKEIKNIDNKLNVEYKIIEELERELKSIKDKLNKFSTTREKVNFLYEQGFDLKSIADELNYNYAYVRRVASKFKKK